MSKIPVITDEAFMQNPYPTLEHLLAQDRSTKHEATDQWFFTRYKDVESILKSPDFLTDNAPEWIAQLDTIFPYDLSTAKKLSPYFLFFVNPDQHTTMRKTIGQVINRETFENARNVITKIADELIANIPANQEIDFFQAYADPLPVYTIFNILGIPADDYELLRPLVGKITTILFPMNSVKKFKEMNDAMAELEQYLLALLAKKRKNRQSDPFSALAQMHEQGIIETQDELIAICITLILTGEETTTISISSGIYTLARHPEQMQLLKQQPQLIETAVAELLRYESPVTYTARIAKKDLVVNDIRIKKGEKVLVSMSGANRDPRQYTDPNKLDITRKNIKNLAFGSGIHTCLGTVLARMETEIAINHLLQKFSDIRIFSPKIEWESTGNFRLLKSLRVKCTI